VLFAESDAELVEVVADRLTAALRAGGVAIVLATPAHRERFEERMRAAGLDLDQARREGSLIDFGAAETLARLTPHGSFDKDAFSELVGPLVQAATARGPVQIFGELVALLWDQGRVQEAIELEAAWHELLQDTPAALVCAYPSTLLDDGRNAADLQEVCRLHSSVVDHSPFERAWHFEPEIPMAAEGRRLATTALRARGVSGLALDDAEMVIAELAANAVLHGGSAFSVRIRIDSVRVVVEVKDENVQEPFLRPVDDERPSGRGVHLLTALSHRWGIERLADGKVVWAELHR